jgi:hypothetical protein
MLTDYVAPDERLVACPNQDVVYGAGALALDLSPVVVQVPDFGDRFWVYQAVDLRTDHFVQLGKMYGTTPGFYLLVGPNWKGEVPKGITTVFRSPTNTGFIGPRIFQNDTPEDKKAIQTVLRQVLMYPLAEYDGTMKSIDWSKIPKVPPTSTGEEETKWVVPEKFFDELPAVLDDAPPLPGEEARYAQIRPVLEAMNSNPDLKAAMITAAGEVEEQLVTPLFQFRNYEPFSKVAFKAALAAQPGKIICPRSGNNKPYSLDLALLHNFLILKHESALESAEFSAESLHADEAGRMIVA